MDGNWTFNSSSSMMEVDGCAGSNWTWEEDKAFENALATYYNDPNMWDKIASAVPNKTIEDIKHRYEGLCIDVEAIESGMVPVPNYPSNVSVRKGKKKSQQAQRGAPWTEEEHRRFLYGLERFGRGDWRSIARFSVQTKSNSQVASHAQKYFKRLNSARKGKRLSINDIRSVNPEKLLAFEKATTSCMPGCCNENSTGTGTEEAAMRAGNQMLPEHTTEASVDGENQLWPEFPDKAPTETGNPLLQHGRPKKARTDASNQLLPPSPLAGTSVASPISGSSSPMFQVSDISSPPFAVEPVQEAGGPAPPGGLASRLEVPGHRPLEVAPPASLHPYYKTQSSHLYESGGLTLTSRLEITAHPTHADKMAGFYSTDAVMQEEPVQEAGDPTPPVEMPGHLALSSDEMAGIYNTDAVMQDADVSLDNEVETGCSPVNMELDLSLFPHFLD